MNKIDLSLFDPETREYIKNGSMIYEGDIEDLIQDEFSDNIDEKLDDDVSGLDDTKFALDDDKDDDFEPIPAIIV